MSIHSELFKFAAKAGSLEGYLFKRQKVEPLENWVGNIVTMYEKLPIEVKKDIKTELLVVLNRILEYEPQTVPPDLKKKIEGLIKAL